MNIGLTELKQKLAIIRFSKAGTVKKERYDQDISLAISMIEALQDEIALYKRDLKQREETIHKLVKERPPLFYAPERSYIK